MMKFTPKDLKGNVNVSRISPLKEFFILIGGSMAIILSIYIALGLAIDLVVSRMPIGLEQKLGLIYSSMYKHTEATPEELELQKLVDSLSKEMSHDKDLQGQELRYSVSIAQSPLVNAMALPGGNIIVFSGLLEEVESENELAFIMAHELGHFANRDHLKGIGRGLVLMAISFALMGSDSSATDFIMNSTVNVEMKFSRDQESDADFWALDLLNKRYGHVSGAEDFFDRMSNKEETSRILYYFATHPFPDDRVNNLRSKIRVKGYLLKEKTILDEVFSKAK